MPNLTAADVKRLRELTGAGMMACKKALEEAEADFDKAVELLRLKGAKDVDKRAERVTANGLVAAHHEGPSQGALVELDCETDFVAKTDKFQELAAQIVDQVSATTPGDVSALQQAQVSDGKTVQQLIEETAATLGEKLELKRFARFDGTYVASYLHKSDPSLPPTLGVLVELDTVNEEIAKDLTQQIAAMAPKYLTRDEVPTEIVERERRLAEERAVEEGKPERAIPKIVQGRVDSYFKDFVLTEQMFVKDNKKTIAKVLAEAGVTCKRFVRYKVGEV